MKPKRTIKKQDLSQYPDRVVRYMAGTALATKELRAACWRELDRREQIKRGK